MPGSFLTECQEAAEQVTELGERAVGVVIDRRLGAALPTGSSGGGIGGPRFVRVIFMSHHDVYPTR